jgi:hypothetical protein
LPNNHKRSTSNLSDAKMQLIGVVPPQTVAPILKKNSGRDKVKQLFDKKAKNNASLTPMGFTNNN